MNGEDHPLALFQYLDEAVLVRLADDLADIARGELHQGGA